MPSRTNSIPKNFEPKDFQLNNQKRRDTYNDVEAVDEDVE